MTCQKTDWGGGGQGRSYSEQENRLTFKIRNIVSFSFVFNHTIVNQWSVFVIQIWNNCDQGFDALNWGLFEGTVNDILVDDGTHD